MDYKSTDYMIHNQMIGAQFIIILLLFSVADPAVGGGGRNMQSLLLPLTEICFMTYFYRTGG